MQIQVQMYTFALFSKPIYNSQTTPRNNMAEKVKVLKKTLFGGKIKP